MIENCFVCCSKVGLIFRLVHKFILNSNSTSTPKVKNIKLFEKRFYEINLQKPISVVYSHMINEKCLGKLYF